MAATTPGLQSQAKLRELKWSEPKNCYGKQQDRRHMQGSKVCTTTASRAWDPW